MFLDMDMDIDMPQSLIFRAMSLLKSLKKKSLKKCMKMKTLRSHDDRKPSFMYMVFTPKTD